MKSTKVLELLNVGKIEELKAALKDEIYNESLKGKPDAKKRYMAMKKYFTYHNTLREILQKPCPVEIQGIKYTAFTNSYSLALTKEDCGELELCDKPELYPDVSRLLSYQGTEGKIDFHKVIAEAKSKGYKLKKSEVEYAYKYLMHYNGSYFKIGLIDSTYAIIDDGEENVVYHVEGNGRPMTVITNLGVCVIMPVRMEAEPDPGLIIIEAKG